MSRPFPFFQICHSLPSFPSWIMARWVAGIARQMAPLGNPSQTCRSRRRLGQRLELEVPRLQHLHLCSQLRDRKHASDSLFCRRDQPRLPCHTLHRPSPRKPRTFFCATRSSGSASLSFIAARYSSFFAACNATVMPRAPVCCPVPGAARTLQLPSAWFGEGFPTPRGFETPAGAGGAALMPEAREPGVSMPGAVELMPAMWSFSPGL